MNASSSASSPAREAHVESDRARAEAGAEMHEHRASPRRAGRRARCRPRRGRAAAPARRSRCSRRSGRRIRRRPGSRGRGGSRSCVDRSRPLGRCSSPGPTSARFTSAAAALHAIVNCRRPGLQAAALVDDAVAVVVDRVEAELGPRRRARLTQRHPCGRRQVRRRDIVRALPAVAGAHDRADRDERPQRRRRRSAAMSDRARSRHRASCECPRNRDRWRGIRLVAQWPGPGG